MSKRFWLAAALWLPLVSTQVFAQPASWEELNAAGYEAYEQARYAEAEPLYQRALAIREKALGPEHPSTATVLRNYTRLLRALRREERGELDLEISQSIGLASGNLKTTSLSTAPFREHFKPGPPVALGGRNRGVTFEHLRLFGNEP